MISVEDDVYDGFVRVAMELVGDVGERLVYRAHLYAQSDIQGYKPAQGDLAYPEKLKMMQVSETESNDRMSVIE